MELEFEIVGRTLIIFLFLSAGLRLLGKRTLAQYNIYDLAMVMAVANGIQNGMTKGSGLLRVGLLSAGTLLFASRLVSRIFTRYPSLESRLLGTPTILVHDGVLLRDQMKREQVTEMQLMQALREYGVASVAETQLVVLEVDGAFSVVAMKDAHGDAGVSPAKPTAPGDGP